MKKKIAFGVVLLVLAVAAFGFCTKYFAKTTFDRVEENMSERTSTYFYGSGETFSASISSGQREEPYLLNGKSEKKVDFALLTITLNQPLAAKLVKATVKIDGEECEKELEINGLNPLYMVDLERKLTGGENIELSYGGQWVTLENLSKNFAIDDKKALEIASKQLEDKIVSCKNGNVLNAECYLRVLDKAANNLDKVFWCFTVINVKNESFSVVISTADGSVLAKN